MEIVTDFRKSVEQAGDGAFWGVLIKTVGLTILLLLGATFGLAWTIGLLLPDQMVLPWVGEVTFLDEAATIAAIPILLILSMFMMFPVAAAIIGIFLDEIAGAVEAKHYPQAPPVRPLGLSEAVVDAIRFAAVFLGVNFVALVVYVLFAPFAPFVFWAVNGYLLGREYFSQVALRRMPPKDAHALRRKYRGRVWFAGILMAIPLSIPFLNLIIPILGVATFTHQFHRLSKRG